MKRLRIALIVNLSPRKLGSFEAWIQALAAEAAGRGSRVDVFGWGPIHSALLESLHGFGTGWTNLSRIEDRPFAFVRLLRRQYDVLHLNLFAPRSRIALLTYAAWPARVLYVERVSAATGGDAPSQSWRSRLFDRHTMVRVAGVAGVSDYVRHRAVARFALDDRRARTLYNGVDVDRFHPGEPCVPEPDGLRVLAVANLIPAKGVHHLLEGFAGLDRPKARLRVVGDGPEQANLKSLSEHLGITDRVEFLGLRNDVPELLRETDVFVHPATWAEAFGNTVAEAMASGCAVVASNVGAIPELIEDGTSGLLVPAGDHDAIQRALQRLADRPELRTHLGGEARRRVEERFSLKASAKAHLDWCEEIAARPRHALAPPARLRRRGPPPVAVG